MNISLYIIIHFRPGIQITILWNLWHNTLFTLLLCLHCFSRLTFIPKSPASFPFSSEMNNPLIPFITHSVFELLIAQRVLSSPCHKSTCSTICSQTPCQATVSWSHDLDTSCGCFPVGWHNSSLLAWDHGEVIERALENGLPVKAWICARADRAENLF